MADLNQPYWHFLSEVFQSVAQKAVEGLPYDLAPKTRLVYVPLKGTDVVTMPADNPLQVQLEEVHARVKETAAFADSRSHELLVQNSAKQAVARALGTISFCGDGRVHGDHVVVPVVHVESAAFGQCPSLRQNRIGNMSFPQGLADALIEVVLEEATSELSKPQPCSDLNDCMRLEPSSARQRAARRFLDHIAASVSAPHRRGKLFDDICTIASLRYESRANQGGLLLARRDHPAVIRRVQFSNHVRLAEPMWARKVVQLASNDTLVLCDQIGLYGLGNQNGYDAQNEDLFEVRFVDHHRWHLTHDGVVLLDVHYGMPNLPRPRLSKEKFVKSVCNEFSNEGCDPEKLWALASIAVEKSRHGALLVVSEKAQEEATRLKGQSTPIQAQELDPTIMQAFTEVDGAVLVDPFGRCFAFGIILDGKASDQGSPARGARYNSSVRYVESVEHKVMALVISEDGHVNPIVRT